MRTIRYDEPSEMLRWAEEQIGVVFRSDAQAIGLERNGVLCAVTVFDTFSPGDCQMHVAATDRCWWTLDYARHVAIHAFRTAKRRRITCTISEDNVRAVRFARRLGCKLEGRLREAGAEGEDQLIFGLLKRECRYLPPVGLAKAS